MLKRLLCGVLLSLAIAPGAFAKGGNYVFDGGTRAEQAQVKAALDVSSFDFGVVPGRVTIHVGRGVDSHAAPGQIWLDADLLDSGRFSWGVVQHEYGHQVDFALLDDAKRARLAAVLGGSAWFGGEGHAGLTSERFADLVSWAYWTSPDNVMRPASAADEGGQVSPAAFRAALADLLPATAMRTLASVTVTKAPRKR